MEISRPVLLLLLQLPSRSVPSPTSLAPSFPVSNSPGNCCQPNWEESTGGTYYSMSPTDLSQATPVSPPLFPYGVWL